MKKTAIRVTPLPWLLAAAAVCGCNRANYPNTTPVSGTVTYKGAPVDGATVALVPDSPSGKAASAKTDAQGNFKATTFQDDDGAVPGKYAVTVSKIILEGEISLEPQQALLDKGKEVPQPKHKDELPVKYKDPKKSGLTADVPESGEVILTLELTD